MQLSMTAEGASAVAVLPRGWAFMRWSFSGAAHVPDTFAEDREIKSLRGDFEDTVTARAARNIK